MTEDSMSEQDNLRVARQGWDAWNAHDPDSFVKLIADDFVSESDTVPAPLRGREAARQSMQMYFKAFPGLHFDIEQMIASGEHVITRWHGTGTHKGELMGIPPTNNAITLTVSEIYRIADGKIAEQWVTLDALGMMQQLGVIPAPGQAAS